MRLANPNFKLHDQTTTMQNNLSPNIHSFHFLTKQRLQNKKQAAHQRQRQETAAASSASSERQQRRAESSMHRQHSVKHSLSGLPEASCASPNLSRFFFFVRGVDCVSHCAWPFGFSTTCLLMLWCSSLRGKTGKLANVRAFFLSFCSIK